MNTTNNETFEDLMKEGVTDFVENNPDCLDTETKEEVERKKKERMTDEDWDNFSIVLATRFDAVWGEGVSFRQFARPEDKKFRALYILLFTIMENVCCGTKDMFLFELRNELNALKEKHPELAFETMNQFDYCIDAALCKGLYVVAGDAKLAKKYVAKLMHNSPK